MTDKEAEAKAEEHWKFMEKWLHMAAIDFFIHGVKHEREKNSIPYKGVDYEEPPKE